VRRFLDAVVLALLGYALLTSGAGAETLSAARATDVRVIPLARVTRRFGAAVRSAPSSDAPVLDNVQCGDILPVIGFEHGWVQVLDGDTESWVGGGRVSVGSPPAPASCRTARALYVDTDIAAYVDSGCLSLRASASREARMLACVKNGHEYHILDGPFDPGTGEDWFEVYSASTGTGWALAKYLYPV
jgi:hypothetical protein